MQASPGGGGGPPPAQSPRDRLDLCVGEPCFFPPCFYGRIAYHEKYSGQSVALHDDRMLQVSKQKVITPQSPLMCPLKALSPFSNPDLHPRGN